MAYEFRPPSVKRYEGMPNGLGLTERQLKITCALIWMAKTAEYCGEGHPNYSEAQSRALGWTSK